MPVCGENVLPNPIRVGSPSVQLTKIDARVASVLPDAASIDGRVEKFFVGDEGVGYLAGNNDGGGSSWIAGIIWKVVRNFI